MKILITTGIFPPDIGGPATYVPLIADVLSKKNHDVIVITLSKSIDYKDNHLYKVHRIKRKQNKFLRLLKTIFKIIKAGKDSDVILANGLYLEAVLANIFLRKPIVHKFVGDYAWEKAYIRKWTKQDFETFQNSTEHSFKVIILKNIRNYFSKKATHIIVPSFYLKKIVKNWGIDEKKISVVYNAIPDIELKENNIQLKTNTKYNLLYVGRLAAWKNVDSLIKLIYEIPETSLIIVGEGEEENNLKNLTNKLKVENKVYFLGNKEKNYVHSLMKQSSIFILFSSYEGFPHIIIEAMKCGIPIITTNAGGTPEIAKHKVNCLMVEKNNYNQLKQAVNELLSNPELVKILTLNAKETTKEYTIEKMVSYTEEILLKAIENTI
jgi:glycosyltransferase involved in cell wall biosynthesis